jgi:hypothetical protein
MKKTSTLTLSLLCLLGLVFAAQAQTTEQNPSLLAPHAELLHIWHEQMQSTPESEIATTLSQVLSFQQSLNRQPSMEDAINGLSLRDSTYRYLWNLESAEWIANERQRYEYNEIGLEVANTIFRRQAPQGDWSPIDQFVSIYGSDGILSSRQQYAWDESLGGWATFRETSFEYNGFGQLTVSLAREWNTESNAWVPKSRTIFSYNDLGNIEQVLLDNWNSLANDWLPSLRNTFSYDDQGRQVSSLVELAISGAPTWQNLSLSTRMYDGSSALLAESILSSWSIAQWAWVRSSRDLFEYNADDQLSVRYNYQWDGTVEQWRNRRLHQYDYDAQGNQVEMIISNWDAAAADWSNANRTEHFYSLLVSVHQVENGPEYRLFPNPAHDWLQMEGLERAEVEIIDLNGRLLSRHRYDGGVLAIGHLPKGIYVLRIKRDDGWAALRFAKQ